MDKRRFIAAIYRCALIVAILFVGLASGAAQSARAASGHNFDDGVVLNDDHGGKSSPSASPSSSASPSASASASPSASASASPSASASASPSASGSPHPSASAEPSEAPEPSESPRPSASGSPRPSSSASPSPSPGSNSGHGKFNDVPDDHPNHGAIQEVSDRGIIRGYGDGRFGPDDHTLRAQMAAMIARSMGWELEDHGNRFEDRCDDHQNCIDDDLWRNIAALAAHGVARGYEDGTYAPFKEVSQIQAISFITRAMVAAGKWTPVTVDNPAIYPNVPLSSGHRLDLLTYVQHAGAIPNRPADQPWADWDAASTRAWFAQALVQAIQAP